MTMLGLGLGIPLSHAATPSAFDPATLALSLYLDAASYAAGTWTGKASAGTSGAHNATSDGADPTVGAMLNGIATVSFARASSQRLALASAISSYVAAGAWSAWALVKLNAPDVNNAQYYGDDCIFSDSGGSFWNLGVRSTGPTMGVTQFGGGETAEAAYTTAAWQLLQWRFDGASLQARVNAGAWSTHASSNISTVTHTGLIGSNYNKTAFIDGLVASLGLAQTKFDDATFENIRKGLDARFALSL